MAIQWKAPETKDRLIAALIAASPNINMNEIARMFGQGATYDAVEGQLRKAKILAKELTEEAKDRPAPAKALSRMKSTASVKSPVNGARVTKAKKPTKIKAEESVERRMLDALHDDAGSDDEEQEI
ncbi:hypothetical protein C7974DRAFT_397562 [Boeremia exigua]|uniref:uncharacterized protein n=1 Tax=Boeremia exigua TaxID=749465 RepID=UPI001E8E3A08|nr:uncharacterized protein C7974DRAFT_397562 [Boeremia exigua]KAH6622043.1 hypothetical protein C7974DRAFT_397562 [Boeremia exigua]